MRKKYTGINETNPESQHRPKENKTTFEKESIDQIQQQQQKPNEMEKNKNIEKNSCM